MEKYIPLDKSFMIRLGVLDIIEGKNDVLRYLEGQEDLGEDLVSLKKVLAVWDSNKEIDVGESGTLYRFLQFVSWKLGLDKKFVKQGTLKERRILTNPYIVNRSQSELLRLDKGTSQWASAAVLCGDKERIEEAPEKLKLSYEVMDSGDREPREDKTILGQATTFVNRTLFEPKHSEDYCFARAFQMITKEEGEKR